MKAELRRVDVVSTCRLGAVLYAVVGVFVGPAAMLGALSAGADFLSAVGAAVIGTVTGIVLYPLVGSLFTALTIVVYNFAAGKLGGVQFELSTRD